MRQTMLAQSRAPGRVIGWTDLSHTGTQYMDVVEIFNVSLDLATIYYPHFSGYRASFVYSCHSILECYNMFSGVKFSIRLFDFYMEQ